MDTNQKCREIIEAIVDLCNKRMDDGKEGWAISFGPDWGGPNLTVEQPELGHTHVGGFHEEATFDELVDDLHGQLTAGRGLSWEK